MQKMLEDNEIDIGTSTHKTPDLKKIDFSRPIVSNECIYHYQKRKLRSAE